MAAVISLFYMFSVHTPPEDLIAYTSFLYLVIIIPTLLVFGVFLGFFEMPYVKHVRNGYLAMRSIKSGWKFVAKNFGFTFTFSIIYTITVSLAILVPGASMISGFFGQSFVATVLHLYYEEKGGKTEER